jgi:transposase
MPQNFLTCDRDQPLLLPPDLRDWLPEDHLAWFVIEAIEELDVDPFYAAYRSDGHGRAAHEPKMMLTLLAYAYAVGERSSRAIERRCREDIAFRVICANQVPDHATIARFRVRHEEALADLFGQVLGLCAAAGIVEVGVLAVDGTKIEASASNHSNRDYERIATEILAEAGRIDAAEDEVHGEARGDELPAHLASRGGEPGCERPRSASPKSGPRTQSQFQGEDQSALSSAASALSRTGGPSAKPVATTRPTAPAASLRTARAAWRPAPPSPTSHPLNPRARSTRPIPTPAT